MAIHLARATLAVACTASLALAQSPAPATRAESSRWTETSRYADVVRHLAALAGLPHGDRVAVASFGRSWAGRELPVARCTLGGDGERLRALIVGNIHAGEVEGKEAIQILLREIALGEHEDLLRSIDLWFVPIFNADGNEEVHRGNRVEQNGPEGGVGQRANAQGLDLNRDFVKNETPEVRALLGLLREHDPHLFMDLHTTNGSYHGYHLTYAPSLCTNVDDALAAFGHDTLLPAVRAAVHDGHGFRVFDYGNFGRGEGGRPDPKAGWFSYGSEPRYGTNYAGLRNRLSVLSEAYSYLPFEQRVAVTRAFVLETLRAVASRAGEVRRLCAAADARLTSPGDERPAFRYDTDFAPPVEGELLVGAVESVEVPGFGRRRVASESFEAIRAPLHVRFASRKSVAFPAAWAVVAAGDEPHAWRGVEQALLRHGIEVGRLTEPATAEVEEFRPDTVSRRRFQGLATVSLSGAFAVRARELPSGTLVVRSDQRLARVAAQLLEAHSEDSLATWGAFGEAVRTHADAGEDLAYPVVRLSSLAGLRARASELDASADLALAAPLALLPAGPRSPRVELRIDCIAEGRRVGAGGFETAARFTGRELLYSMGPQTFRVRDEAVSATVAAAKDLPIVIARDALVTYAEVLELAAALRSAGHERVWFDAERR